MSRRPSKESSGAGGSSADAKAGGAADNGPDRAADSGKPYPQPYRGVVATVLRGLYWHAAVATGVTAIFSAYQMWGADASSDLSGAEACATTGTVLAVWLTARVLLGVAQIVIHLGVLNPVRCSSRKYKKWVEEPGRKGPLYGLNHRPFFRKVLGICNVCIFCVLVPTAALALTTSSCAADIGSEAARLVGVSEAITAGIWFAVLSARIIGIATGTTKRMFHMAWD